jgi:UTP--glucose-1-phosphate uridylyltransferase
MEVTNKTRADVKGGTLIEYEGKVKLLELASVPHDKVDEFKSIRKFKVFNTNNLWISLPAIEKYIDQLNQLEIIINYKEMRKIKVIQLECACGSAIEKFTKAIGINVDRSRFLPVKSTSDLLPIQSNIYKLENGSLIFNPQRVEKIGEATLPIIKLGREFAKVGDYMRRFKGIPDILELDNLTVIGDVVFGKNVSLKGTVMIIANPGSRIEIPDGSILENKIITGNLTMIDY